LFSIFTCAAQPALAGGKNIKQQTKIGFSQMFWLKPK
jgi:hypothetical protein